MRARQRHQEEERGVVRAHFVHQEFQVAPDGIHRVERKAQNVADVRGNIGVAIRLNQVPVLVHLVLFLSGRRQIARIDAFHADEHVDAAGLPRFRDEVLDLPRKHVDLHHELDRNALFVAQLDQRVENGFPVFVAREIIVGEKVKT